MFVDRLNEIRAQLDGAVPYGLETIETTLWHSPTAAVNDLICTHDFDGRILSVNGTACEALGVPAAALSRSTIQELLPEGGASGYDAYIQRLRRHGLDAGMMRET
jgi:PAS domain S-box-containing protein